MSISLDFSSLLTTAGELVNGIFPIFVPIIGFALAFGIIGFLYNKISDVTHKL
jgi:hypothetical protein